MWMRAASKLRTLLLAVGSWIPHPILRRVQTLGQVAGEGQSLPLPPDVWPAVFQRLDLESLAQAAQVCRAWRRASQEEEVWEALCLRRGWQKPAGSGGQAEGAPDATAATWRDVCRRNYEAACYDCFQPCTRTTCTLGFAPLVVRLCQACARGYESPRPQQRLVCKTQAKQRFCLKDSDLAPLRHAVEANPANPAFLPMHLYRQADVHAAAVARHGSADAAEREYRRRLARR